MPSAARAVTAISPPVAGRPLRTLTAVIWRAGPRCATCATCTLLRCCCIAIDMLGRLCASNGCKETVDEGPVSKLRPLVDNAPHAAMHGGGWIPGVAAAERNQGAGLCEIGGEGAS